METQPQTPEETPPTGVNPAPGDIAELSDFVALADGGVKATLANGRVVTVRGLDMNDLADFETEFGAMDEVLGEDGKAKIGAMRNMLWRSLRKDEPELTEHDVGAMFEISDFTEDPDGDDDGIGIKIINRLVQGPKVKGNRAARRAAEKGARQTGPSSTPNTPTEQDGP